jgi:hypothetical protein
MPLMQLETSKILIHFDNVIKSGDLFILRTIQHTYAEKFKEFIDLDFLKGIDDDALELLLISRRIVNPLEWLKIKEFNYKKNYDYFKKKYKNMYVSSRRFPMIDDVHAFLKTYFIEQIIFCSEKYDDRIAFEIKSLYGDNKKIIYAGGKIDAIIDKMEPETVFYPYVDDIIPIAKKNPQIIFAIPAYGFNFDEEDKFKVKDDKLENIGYYSVLKGKHELYFG